MNKETKYLIIIECLVIFTFCAITKIMFMKNDINNLVRENIEIHNAINECVNGE